MHVHVYNNIHNYACNNTSGDVEEVHMPPAPSKQEPKSVLGKRKKKSGGKSDFKVDNLVYQVCIVKFVWTCILRTYVRTFVSEISGGLPWL